MPDLQKVFSGDISNLATWLIKNNIKINGFMNDYNDYIKNRYSSNLDLFYENWWEGFSINEFVGPERVADGEKLLNVINIFSNIPMQQPSIQLKLILGIELYLHIFGKSMEVNLNEWIRSNNLLITK